MDLVQERLDLLLPSGLLVLEGVGLSAIEVGLSGTRDENT
jgi:hypothetical protein